MNILKKIIQHCKNTEKKKEVSPRLGKSYFIMKLNTFHIQEGRNGMAYCIYTYIPHVSYPLSFFEIGGILRLDS